MVNRKKSIRKNKASKQPKSIVEIQANEEIKKIKKLRKTID